MQSGALSGSLQASLALQVLRLPRKYLYLIVWCYSSCGESKHGPSACHLLRKPYLEVTSALPRIPIVSAHSNLFTIWFQSLAYKHFAQLVKGCMSHRVAHPLTSRVAIIIALDEQVTSLRLSKEYQNPSDHSPVQLCTSAFLLPMLCEYS